MKAEASVKFQCQLHKSNGKSGEPKGAAAASMSEEFYGFLVFISVLLLFFYAKKNPDTHTHTRARSFDAFLRCFCIR